MLRSFLLRRLFCQRALALLPLLIIMALTGLAQGAQDKAGQGEELLTAARRGDVATAKALLDKGVDVNSKNNYGATALSYACDRGNTEMVRLLLERGANPNVKDTFYGATPMSWAADKGHTEIVRLLIEKGAEEKGAALSMGVEKGSVELVKTVLDKGGVPAAALTKALSQAEADNKTEIADLLKKAGAVGFARVSDETLKLYAGVYKHEQVGTLTISLKDGKFIGQIAGQRSFTLGAVNDTTFTIIEIDGATFVFTKEGDKVSGVTLKQGGGTFVFKRTE